MDEPIPNERWDEILDILSLDVVTPYVARMGLITPDGFQHALQSHVAKLLQCETKEDVAAEPLPNTVTWVASIYGSQFMEYLDRWAVNIFEQGDDGASAWMWSSITRRSNRFGSETSPPIFVRRLDEIRNQIPPLSIYNLGPVSDWDLVIYNLRERNDYTNPMELVQSCIDNYDFRRAWMLTSREMPDPIHMVEVKTWGLPIAQQMDMPLEDLGDPGSWPPLPPPWAPV